MALPEFVRRDWYLYVAFVVALGAGVVAYLFAGKDDAASTDLAGQEMRDLAERTKVSDNPGPFTALTTVEQEAKADIAGYQEKFDAAPNSEEAALMLERMGQLHYAKLMDPKGAITNWELLIQRFPDYEGIKKIYPMLAACYEQLKDDTSARAVYQRMLNYYPEDSQEHLLAKQKLE